ncbi:MAG TPA: SDR family NAD(P)-dependent oxidoreductase [Nocardioidaceae bacterium]|nr:SDR family NAD(P)-dependent oxidoreductase [Nocardioidaceae bacterium]
MTGADGSESEATAKATAADGSEIGVDGGPPLALVIGAGPGVGAAVARRFGQAGYDVSLVARDATRLDALGSQLQSEGITTGWTAVDITDEGDFAAAVRRFGERSGRIDVLHFNPSVTTMKDGLALAPAELLRDVHIGVAALLTAVQAARPYLPSGARVTATGSMSADVPWAAAASLGVQKAGLRSLVGALDETLHPLGVRAMTLTVRGVVDPGTKFAPNRIADALFRAAATPDRDWRTDVPYPDPAA